LFGQARKVEFRRRILRFVSRPASRFIIGLPLRGLLQPGVREAILPLIAVERARAAPWHSDGEPPFRTRQDFARKPSVSRAGAATAGAERGALGKPRKDAARRLRNAAAAGVTRIRAENLNLRFRLRFIRSKADDFAPDAIAMAGPLLSARRLGAPATQGDFLARAQPTGDRSYGLGFGAVFRKIPIEVPLISRDDPQPLLQVVLVAQDIGIAENRVGPVDVDYHLVRFSGQTALTFRDDADALFQIFLRVWRGRVEEGEEV
jgi:hypothetical protein